MVFVSSEHHAGRWWPKLVATSHLGAWSTHEKQDGTNSKSSHLSAPAFCHCFIVRTFFTYIPGHERPEYDPSAPVSLPALRPGGVDVRERVEGCRTKSSVHGGNLFASAAERGQIDK